MGDILEYETDLSADEDDVFKNKGADYIDADQHVSQLSYFLFINEWNDYQ